MILFRILLNFFHLFYCKPILDYQVPILKRKKSKQTERFQFGRAFSFPTKKYVYFCNDFLFDLLTCLPVFLLRPGEIQKVNGNIIIKT